MFNEEISVEPPPVPNPLAAAEAEMYVSSITDSIWVEELINPTGLFVTVDQSAEPEPALNPSIRASVFAIRVAKDAESLGYVTSLNLLFAVIEFF